MNQSADTELCWIATVPDANAVDPGACLARCATKCRSNEHYYREGWCGGGKR